MQPAQKMPDWLISKIKYAFAEQDVSAIVLLNNSWYRYLKNERNPIDKSNK